MGEIVTFQCGEFANWIGSQFFNVSNQYLDTFSNDNENPYVFDVTRIFEPSFSPNHYVSRNPRLGFFDIVTNLGPLPEAGYEQAKTDYKHSMQDSIDQLNMLTYETERMPTHVVATHPSNKDEPLFFGTLLELNQRLELIKDMQSSVKYWTEVFPCHTSAKSSILSKDHTLKHYPMDSWSNGDVFKDSIRDFNDKVEDLIRFMVEKCDNCQCIQLFSDIFSGYGNVSKTLLEYIHDFDSKKPVVTYACDDEYDYSKEHYSYVVENKKFADFNRALTMTSLVELSNLIIPLNKKQLNNILPSKDVINDWHGSYIAGMFSHGVLTPLLLNHGFSSLSSVLNPRSNMIFAEPYADFLHHSENWKTESLLSNNTVEKYPFGLVNIGRGLKSLRKPKERFESLFETFETRNIFNCLHDEAIPVPQISPLIWPNNLTEDGFFKPKDFAKVNEKGELIVDNTIPNTIPSLIQLSANTNLQPYLIGLGSNFDPVQRISGSNMDDDELSQVRDVLISLGENYDRFDRYYVE
eukprot:TRINITY_DN2352_c0_g1_i1.p1 TRINITY_DN2352_c0_g1~~TRINITY_DN2352_c0_g1_i1.p1  ORF type:complete len:522 (+),score=127.34 TRINITY_DN2352_c0_g1_i1:45-1610(+)